MFRRSLTALLFAAVAAGCSSAPATSPAHNDDDSSCSCDSSCCSATEVTCLDGTTCCDGYYCNYQTGSCEDDDPCQGDSGNWTCGDSTSLAETAPSNNCSCDAACCSAQNATCTDGSTCSGGYYCNYQTGKCDKKDPCDGNSGNWSCGTPPPSTTGESGNGGTPPSTGVGPNGGTLASLNFGLVGDTRPPSSDDVSGYPSSIIGAAFRNMAQASTVPAFIVAGGDYMFSDDSKTPSASTATQQANLYMSAFQSSGFPNQLFMALGNHECNTATTSNCGTGNADGITPNYSAFLNMLSQVGLGSSPYYTVNVSSAAGVAPAWTSKFVVIACNAWDSTQQSWLQSALAAPTNYTFIVRHETVEEDQEPGVPASPCGMASSAMIAPYANSGQVTLLLTGHTHYYKINDQPTDIENGVGVTMNVPELVIGNGGAALRSDATAYGADGYGYVICNQVNDPNQPLPDIACQEYDAMTGTPSTAAGGAIQVTAGGAIVSGG